MLHQMDHDNRFRLLRDFGESQVPLPTLTLFFVCAFRGPKQKNATQRSVYTHFFLVLNDACYKFSDTWTHVEFGNLWFAHSIFFVLPIFFFVQDFVPQTGPWQFGRL
jgi:hypothetical protein